MAISGVPLGPALVTPALPSHDRRATAVTLCACEAKSDLSGRDGGVVLLDGWQHSGGASSARRALGVRRRLRRYAVATIVAGSAAASVIAVVVEARPRGLAGSFGAAAVRTAKPPARDAATRLTAGAWSYFADPRIVADARSMHVYYTGVATMSGHVKVVRYDARSRTTETVSVGRTGGDDHNNPAFHLRRDGKLTAFFSPHSGRLLPRDRRSAMYYRTTVKAGDIARWTRRRTVPVNAPGGLGYTYPNPLRIADGVFLAWRGGGWLPTYSVRESGGRWSRAREIARGPAGQRPYAKYASAGPGRRIAHIAYTERHPVSGATGVHYLRYQHGSGLYRADGSWVGGRSAMPVPSRAGDTVEAYNDEVGSSWAMDVADDHGRPVIVYAQGVDGRPIRTYRYARYDGKRWTAHTITTASEAPWHQFEGGHFEIGGVVLDHEDPSTVVLSRVEGATAVVQEWTTPDGGTTWMQVRRLSPAGRNCFRPAVSRGDGTESKLVGFICGRLDHWTDFDTDLYVRYITARG
jgi:hypothetical protein